VANPNAKGRPKKDHTAFAVEARLRLRERDERAAADTRTLAEQWLGDPPPGRSALVTRSSHQSAPRRPDQ